MNTVSTRLSWQADREEQTLDLPCINTLRRLAIDQVQKANSGHPGTPMGAAPTAYCVWQRFLRFDPEDAAWPDRDRFVLSVGHASALLYGLPHLCGVKAEPGATSLDHPRRSGRDDGRPAELPPGR
ncbi:hypothetical protein [Rhodoferax sp.]|uniref:hypothetical protein n=1 Tax=Rhodoferax sp. TaxID=50421 RepID=UPI0025D62EEC|nr:hypothetical protein [Rhodoferax sp.]